jgi:hypothetical protein
MTLALRTLMKISPAGRNDKSVDSSIFAGKRACVTPRGSNDR